MPGGFAETSNGTALPNIHFDPGEWQAGVFHVLRHESGPHSDGVRIIELAFCNREQPFIHRLVRQRHSGISSFTICGAAAENLGLAIAPNRDKASRNILHAIFTSAVGVQVVDRHTGEGAIRRIVKTAHASPSNRHPARAAVVNEAKVAVVIFPGFNDVLACLHAVCLISAIIGPHGGGRRKCKRRSG